MKAVYLGLMLAMSLACEQAVADSQGKQVFNTHCVHCHADAPNAVGTRQLRKRYRDQRAVLEQRTDLAPEYVAYVVRNGLHAMPQFTPANLSPAALEALQAYLSPASD